jgi:phosphoribosyl 1,2-cyclic phosphodiesterase
MRVQFWGVRGSVPAPLSPQQVQQKIAQVLDRASPADMQDAASRARFFDSLPGWLYGTTGGNTSCLEVSFADGSFLVLDCGTGMRVLSKSKLKKPPGDKTYRIFISHCHVDHLQGLPFFDQAYNDEYTVHFYSAMPNLRETLFKQMELPFFPVQMTAFTKKIHFHTLTPEKSMAIGSVRIAAKKIRHPGNSYAFSLVEGGKKFIYATDVELLPGDLIHTPSDSAFFENADAIVLDAQYSCGEALEKAHWGHSSFFSAVNFADFWKIKNLYLFHHEPSYDDVKINSIYQAAIQYAEVASKIHVKVFTAVEGMVVDI